MNKEEYTRFVEEFKRFYARVEHVCSKLSRIDKELEKVDYIDFEHDNIYTHGILDDGTPNGDDFDDKTLYGNFNTDMLFWSDEQLDKFVERCISERESSDMEERRHRMEMIKKADLEELRVLANRYGLLVIDPAEKKRRKTDEE